MALGALAVLGDLAKGRLADIDRSAVPHTEAPSLDPLYWLDYTDSAYALMEDDKMESAVMHFLDGCKREVAFKTTDDAGAEVIKYRKEKFNPKPSDVAEVYKLLAQLTHVEAGAIDPPFFLDRGTGKHKGLDAANLIPCRNGLLDVTTGKLRAPTQQFFTRTALKIDYDPKAECPLFRKFLTEVLCDDGLTLLMQQWLGYLITTDVSIQKFLYLQGKPRSGKGTISRIIDQLVGPDNVASHTLRDLAGGCGREDLIGKSLLKFNDMNTSDKQALNEAASIVNSITGQDRLHIQRKFKGAIDIVPKMHVKIGNQFPDFGDHAAAIGARMIPIPFRVSFEGREDTKLTDKLLAELPGILYFALAGLRDLREWAHPRR